LEVQQETPFDHRIKTRIDDGRITRVAIFLPLKWQPTANTWIYEYDHTVTLDQYLSWRSRR